MITLIAACSRNWVIGKNNQLIWHLPEDLKRFKKLTTGGTLLMGRKTYESIGKPLPNRTNLILTSDKSFKADGCIVYNDLFESLRHNKDILVIGGEQIYNQTIEIADKIELTIIDKDYDGDAYFPKVDSSKWLKSATEIHQNENFRWMNVTYIRKHKSI